jgi:HAD superfamily hydrolase (TIGR01549 family)
MSRYKAIFFDRDGTITYYDEAAVRFRDTLIGEWSGHPFSLPYEKFIDIFDRTKAIDFSAAHPATMAEEKLFFKEFFKILFEAEGIKENLKERAELLTGKLWVHERYLFAETAEVLDYFSDHGYKMGVISDTGISLEETLVRLGIAKYFTSFTSSGSTGASKPSPVIFNAALAAQGVTAEESIYVDDYDAEADGAREQGFTSFLIDRSGKNKNEWSITSLKQIIEFVEKQD